jgi:hypothetical protein
MLDMLSFGPMWTIERGLMIVQTLQPGSRKFGYHLALGGGVLNSGASEHDLDLYFLPLDNTESPPDPEGLMVWLDTLLGDGEDLQSDDYARSTRYYSKRKHFVGGRRIDIFII